MDKKRKLKERKFKNWESTSSNGRLYFCEVAGKYGWSDKYFKEVDEKEQTVRFWQKIYDQNMKLREIHEKYPEDKGHKKLGSNDG